MSLNIRSLNDIVTKLLPRNTDSKFVEWLLDVIKDVLKKYDNECLTYIDLFDNTAFMFRSYKIYDNDDEILLICQNLFLDLLKNNYLENILEKHPKNSCVLALFYDDNLWYPGKILSIINKNTSYMIIFDGYNNTQQTDISNIQINTNNEEIDKKEISTKKYVSLINNNDDNKIPSNLLYGDGLDLNKNTNKSKYKNDLIVETEIDKELLEKIERDTRSEFENYINDTINDDDDDDDFNGNVQLKNKKMIKDCQLCDRCIPLTFHHVIPKETHERYIKRYGHNKEELLHTGIWICRPCHSAIHGMYDNWELADKYNNLNSLVESEKVQKWIKYIQYKSSTKHNSDSRTRKPNRIAQLQQQDNMKYNNNNKKKKKSKFIEGTGL